MPRVRDLVSTFIQSEGHKVDVSPIDAGEDGFEILFRTRGQVFSVTTKESEPGSFAISTAYEVPQWAHERTNTAEILEDVGAEYPEIAFIMAHDGGLFVVTAQEETDTPEAFTHAFWDLVARVRDAGAQAIERIVDRTESKAAAEKFISQFMKGQS